MAASTTVLKEFFEGRRRKMFLLRYTHLKTRAGEERIKLELKMPMLNEELQGIPETISEAFETMAKDKSAISRSALNIEYKGMTIEFFSADNSPEPFTGKEGMASATSAMLCKFALVAAGEGEKRELDLQFTAYVPANVAMLDWARLHLHNAFFTEAEYSQSEMEFTPDVEESEIPDSDPDAPADPHAEEVEAPMGKSKSGPRELKAFHEEQVAAAATEVW
jgi:hypothetical protein